MKHDHNVNTDIPVEDLERLIDKATDSAIKIIVVFTAAQILKSILTRESREKHIV